MSLNATASARARLLARAKAEREEFERTLVRYAAERLLYRLGASRARESCILKGASLLTVWMPDPYRATRDIDMLSFGPPDEAAIRALVEEICEVPCPEDGLRFDLSELVVGEIRGAEEYRGKRARFLAFLGTARIRVQMDFGFGDALVLGSEEIEFPTLLQGLPAPRLRAYSRETTVAEKFEVMVKLDRRNSRMKDFHDVWALAGAFAFDGPRLQQAIAACFESRVTPWTAEVPRALTPGFYQISDLERRWRSYLASGAVIVPPPAQFDIIGERIVHFLGPVRNRIVEGAAFDLAWAPRGPWVPRREGTRPSRPTGGS
jgi:predicted nucleotidyltransferase component of viral defense system